MGSGGSAGRPLAGFLGAHKQGSNKNGPRRGRSKGSED
jgi:hypothetical protein